MKRLIYYALIALIVISCDESGDSFGGSTGLPLTIPKTFCAQTPLPEDPTRAVHQYMPESWNGPTTRSYAVVDPDNSNEYFQYWSPGDAISLFFTTDNLKYQLQSYKDSLDMGVFELVGNATQGEALTTGYYYSVYPYKESTTITDWGEVTYQFPENQHYSGDTYANGENGMIAIEPMTPTDSILYFQNFCSYLQLRLIADEGKPITVKKITLTANNERDAIAGEGYVEIYDDKPYVTMNRSAKSRITLDCGDGVELSQDEANPSRFWFVVPGDFTFSEGFSTTILLDNNSFIKKSTSKTIEIARSHIKPMEPFKLEILEPTGPIRYKYHDISIDKPYEFDNHVFYGYDGKPLDIIDQIYDEETQEWVVLLSDTLKEITGNTFRGQYPDIQYIKILNEETSISIDKFAFYGCTADSLMIYNDVDNIDQEAFTGSAIIDLKIDGDVELIDKNTGTGSVIENLIISGDVETINVNAFSGSEHLKIIDIEGNIETIKEGAFTGCDNLHTVDIEGDVNTIGQQAFSGCRNLQSISVNSVETIGYRAFYACSSLVHVDLPGIKYINMGAFRECTSLETINLESVITIDDNAFMDCYSLNTVTISANCTMIGEGAFCNAKSLSTVYCHAVNPPFIKTDNVKNSYVFDSVHANIRIYIPVGSKRNYTNRKYFINNQYPANPNVDATANWWAEEYSKILHEMEFATE